MKQFPPSVCIIIPALNAASSLPSLIDRIRRIAPASCILVVDDGSGDRTHEVAARASASVLRHDRNLGKGGALKSGIRHALEDERTEAIITLDADGQHDPGDLPGFVDVWKRDGADLVIGNRRILGSSMPFHRRLSNVLTSFLVSARTGRKIPDSQCGFRLLTRRFAETVRVYSDGFEAETEWIMRGAASGFRIGWTPVQTVYNAHPSHMKKWATTKAFVRILLQEY